MSSKRRAYEWGKWWDRRTGTMREGWGTWVLRPDGHRDYFVPKGQSTRWTWKRALRDPSPKKKHHKKWKCDPSHASLFDTIRAGDRVTIVTPQGQEMTGRAVMRGPAGWVLNMGGPHGRPGIAHPDNVTRVKPSKSRRAGFDFRDRRRS